MNHLKTGFRFPNLPIVSLAFIIIRIPRHFHLLLDQVVEGEAKRWVFFYALRYMSCLSYFCSSRETNQLWMPRVVCVCVCACDKCVYAYTLGFFPRLLKVYDDAGLDSSIEFFS